MASRKYTAILTLTLVSPDGKVLGTKTENVKLKLDMNGFGSEADQYMKGEIGTLLAAGASNVENCFD